MNLKQAKTAMKGTLVFGDAKQVAAHNHIEAVAELRARIKSHNVPCPICWRAGGTDCEWCKGSGVALADKIPEWDTRWVTKALAQ